MCWIFLLSQFFYQPEGSDDERSPWFVAKKALPVSMALRAFNDLTRAQVLHDPASAWCHHYDDYA